MINCPQLLSTNDDGDCKVLVDWMGDDYPYALALAKEKEGTISPVFTPMGNKLFQVTWAEMWDSFTWYKLIEAHNWAKDQEFREQDEKGYRGFFG
jgi:hypothetical protein